MIETTIYVSLIFVVFLIVVFIFILVSYVYIRHRNYSLLSKIETISDMCVFMADKSYLIIENYNNNLCDIFIITIYLKYDINDKQKSNDLDCYHTKHSCENVIQMTDNDSYLLIAAIDRKDTSIFMYNNVISKCAQFFFPNFLIFDVQKLMKFIFHSELNHHVVWLVEFKEQDTVVSVHSHDGQAVIHHDKMLKLKNFGNLVGKFFVFFINGFNLKYRQNKKKRHESIVNKQ
ncbi:putative transporter [Trachipleistophora hominis]|uniref:Putative transporter n=1 Tax=Trachipleistophora hominis TaxID=72359 RepID=L7JRB5_TRAHO|nr:putative transporter [Trachipleistophora hominis]